jgi:hypothetical protein
VFARGIQLDCQGAVAEQLDEPLTPRPRQSGQTIGDGKLVLWQCGSRILPAAVDVP